VYLTTDRNLARAWAGLWSPGRPTRDTGRSHRGRPRRHRHARGWAGLPQPSEDAGYAVAGVAGVIVVHNELCYDIDDLASTGF
jgi:hypothetical protein